MFSSAINPPAIEYTADESARNAKRLAAREGHPNQARQQFLDSLKSKKKQHFAVPSRTSPERLRPCVESSHVRASPQPARLRSCLAATLRRLCASHLGRGGSRFRRLLQCHRVDAVRPFLVVSQNRYDLSRMAYRPADCPYGLPCARSLCLPQLRMAAPPRLSLCWYSVREWRRPYPNHVTRGHGAFRTFRGSRAGLLHRAAAPALFRLSVLASAQEQAASVTEPAGALRPSLQKPAS